MMIFNHNGLYLLFFFFFNTLRSFTSSSIPLSQLPLLGPDQLNFSNLNASFIYSWKCPPTSSFPSHPPKKYTHRYTLQFNLFSMATHWPHPLYISVFSHGPRFLQSAPCSSPHPQSFILSFFPFVSIPLFCMDTKC